MRPTTPTASTMMSYTTSSAVTMMSPWVWMTMSNGLSHRISWVRMAVSSHAWPWFRRDNWARTRTRPWRNHILRCLVVLSQSAIRISTRMQDILIITAVKASVITRLVALTAEMISGVIRMPRFQIVQTHTDIATSTLKEIILITIAVKVVDQLIRVVRLMCMISFFVNCVLMLK